MTIVNPWMMVLVIVLIIVWLLSLAAAFVFGLALGDELDAEPDYENGDAYGDWP